MGKFAPSRASFCVHRVVWTAQGCRQEFEFPNLCLETGLKALTSSVCPGMSVLYSCSLAAAAATDKSWGNKTAWTAVP